MERRKRDSKIFVLPEAFGPTIVVIPSENFNVLLLKFLKSDNLITLIISERSIPYFSNFLRYLLETYVTPKYNPIKIIVKTRIPRTVKSRARLKLLTLVRLQKNSITFGRWDTGRFPVLQGNIFRLPLYDTFRRALPYGHMPVCDFDIHLLLRQV